MKAEGAQPCGPFTRTLRLKGHATRAPTETKTGTSTEVASPALNLPSACATQHAYVKHFPVQAAVVSMQHTVVSTILSA